MAGVTAFGQTQQGLENRAGVWEADLPAQNQHPASHMTLWIRMNKNVPRGRDPIMLVSGVLRIDSGAASRTYRLNASQTRIQGQTLTFSCFTGSPGQEVFTGEKFTGEIASTGETVTGTWESAEGNSGLTFQRPSGTSSTAKALMGKWGARNHDELCTLHVYATQSGALLSTLDIFRERGGVFGQLVEVHGPGDQGEISIGIPEMNQRMVLAAPPTEGRFQVSWASGTGFCGEGGRSQFEVIAQ